MSGAMSSFLIDAARCTECKMCMIACKDEHVDAAYAPWTAPQPETGQFWIDVKALERGRQPRLRMSYLPVMCQHCGNAACMKVCPEDAIRRRDDGLVWIDPATCNGCGLCQEACPYDVIFMNEDAGIAQKCTGCAHRVDAGELPRCAEVCPHDAILFRDQRPGSGGIGASEDGGGKPEVYRPEFRAAPKVLWRGLPKPWIAGTVIDAAADEVLTGATVTATDLFEDKTARAATDAFGDFWLRGLVDGRKYRLEIAKPGYVSVVQVVTAAGDQDLGTVGLAQSA